MFEYVVIESKSAIILTINLMLKLVSKYVMARFTVDSETFAIILFSRIVLKYILATLKIRDLDMIYVQQ